MLAVSSSLISQPERGGECGLHSHNLYPRGWPFQSLSWHGKWDNLGLSRARLATYPPLLSHQLASLPGLRCRKIHAELCILLPVHAGFTVYIVPSARQRSRVALCSRYGRLDIPQFILLCTKGLRKAPPAALGNAIKSYTGAADPA